MMRNRCLRIGLFAVLAAPSCGGESDSRSPLLALDAVPRDGVSQFAPLPTGDVLVIPVGYRLEEWQGIDSVPGALLDAAGETVCFYDIGGNAGEYVDSSEGSEAEAVDRRFRYMWNSESSFGEMPGAWVATFPDAGPANFVCKPLLSEQEFLALMRTYQSA